MTAKSVLVRRQGRAPTCYTTGIINVIACRCNVTGLNMSYFSCWLYYVVYYVIF